ncbi:hypothetical protein COOONC_21910 [Cooperia oncophora]
MSDIFAKILSDLHPYNIRYLFYMVTPNETIYTNADDIPNFYLDPGMTWTFALILLELLLLDKSKYAFNDTVTSVNSGILFLLLKIGGHDISALFYPTVYEWLHVVDLPNSAFTWMLCFFTQDFVFYLCHRAIHEVGCFGRFIRCITLPNTSISVLVYVKELFRFFIVIY